MYYQLFKAYKFIAKILSKFMNEIPEVFINYVYKQRFKTLLKFLRGEIDKKELMIAFTRHTPVVATYGPAGLNASVKGVGIIVKKEYIRKVINEIYSILRENINKEERVVRVAKLLLDNEELIDKEKLIGIELAKLHTWQNIKEKALATLLFYTPPCISFEVRCRVGIHENDEYWEYANLLHDVFHSNTLKRNLWRQRPVYVFEIIEIYDNSPQAMGKLIYKKVSKLNAKLL